MTKFFTAAATFAAVATVAVSAPAFAQADAATQSFVRNGVEYTYTMENKGNAQILSGTANHGTHPFRLIVRDNLVTGTFDNQPVRFKIDKAKVQALASN